MTPDERADLAEALVPVGLSLAYTVHSEGPPAVTREIAGVPATHLRALAVVLAAMDDLDRTPQELLGWVDARPWTPKPAAKRAPASKQVRGLTHEAWKAYRRGERDPDGWLEAGYRIYERNRGRARHQHEGAA